MPTTRSLLRVIESVRTADGNDGVFRAYWEFGTQTHHHRVREELDVSDALRTAGIDPVHAAAYDDEAWDPEIRRRMDVGLQLAGDTIGTPIIAFDTGEGERVGIFGPVITRVPSPEQSLRLWDGMVSVATVPGFWELKRTRTETSRVRQSTRHSWSGPLGLKGAARSGFRGTPNVVPSISTHT